MEIQLKDKTALVCGSTQGIGWAIAKAFAQAGAHVILMARDEARLKNRLKELPVPQKQTHRYLVADFSQPNYVHQALQAIAPEESVHILVNNTGGPRPGTALEADLDSFQQAFAQHLLCNQVLVQHLTSGMMADRYGRIINIISTSVKIPIPGLGVSNTVRGAVASWAKTLSLELAPHGITVNNILPGFVKTQRLDAIVRNKAEIEMVDEGEMSAKMAAETPAGRFGEPEEIAALATFLASEHAAYINGASIPVDGGRTGTI
jgi:3-oxoacyl-[acyl-carrier protein] reductase